MKAKTQWKNMKDYGGKLKIFLDEHIMPQMIRTENIWKSDSFEIFIYNWKKNTQYIRPMYVQISVVRYKLLEYDRIYVSKGINTNKARSLSEEDKNK